MLRARGVGSNPNLAEAAERYGNRASEANGALMRQSPLAVWGYSLPADVLDAHVRADTRLTHPNRVCEDASSAYIVAMAAAIKDGLSAQQVYRVACEWDRARGQSAGVRRALQAAEDSPPDYLTHKGHVLVALQNAFFQVLHAPSLEEGVVRSVMGGGDTDTNAAIAGALLGAIYGSDNIPDQWRETLRSCRPDVSAKGGQRPRPPTYWPNDLEGEGGRASRLLAAGQAAR
jgi:ADP-ribosylglycohydrolase